jgi:hypothetical protein
VSDREQTLWSLARYPYGGDALIIQFVGEARPEGRSELAHFQAALQYAQNEIPIPMAIGTWVNALGEPVEFGVDVTYDLIIGTQDLAGFIALNKRRLNSKLVRTEQHHLEGFDIHPGSVHVRLTKAVTGESPYEGRFRANMLRQEISPE